MTESNEDLLAKLEQATRVASDEPLDGETAELRESWLALRGLLNAADESAPALVQPSESNGKLRTVVRIFAALAAMLLVAVAAWAVMSKATDSGDSLVKPSNSIAESDSTPIVPLQSGVARVEVEPKNVESSVIEDEYAWDDSFDEQLAATSQAIRSAQSNWSGDSRRYSVLIDQFEQFSDELSEGSL